MKIRLGVNQFFIAIVAAFVFSWSVYSMDINSIFPNNVYVYENTSTRQHPMMNENVRFGSFVTWPKTVSLQLDDWMPDPSVLDFSSNFQNASSENNESVKEWFAAISMGFFTIAMGLMLMFVAGVLLNLR